MKWPRNLLGRPQESDDDPDWAPRPKPPVTMANDLKAIKAYLASAPAKSREAYRAELERLLYWIYYTHKTPLSSFKVKDREAFEAFLRDPQPTEFWCASEPPGNIARYSPKWRPFMMRAIPASEVAVADRKVWAPGDGVLWIDPASGRARDNPGISEVSVAKAVSVVRGLMGWLVDQGYLGYNTWDARSPRRRRGRRHGHRLKDGETDLLQWSDWQYVISAHDQARVGVGKDARSWLRLQCLLNWTVYLDPVPTALANAMDADIDWFTDGTDTVGIWRTVTQSHMGLEPIWLPLHESMVTSYLAWKAECGFLSLQSLKESRLPVFQRLSDPPDGAMTSHQLHNLQKQLMKAGADYARTVANDQEAALRLYRAVDSRLRHTVPNAEGRLHLIRMSTARRGRISLGQADKYLFADQTVPAYSISIQDCLPRSR